MAQVAWVACSGSVDPGMRHACCGGRLCRNNAEHDGTGGRAGELPMESAIEKAVKYSQRQKAVMNGKQRLGEAQNNPGSPRWMHREARLWTGRRQGVGEMRRVKLVYIGGA